MVEVEKANKGYEECTSCHSNKDVVYLRVGTENTSSIKLCKVCRVHAIAKLANVTSTAFDYSTGMSLE